MRDFLIALLLKSTVLLSAAAVLAFVSRNSAAARRHFLWTLALGGVLLLPIVQWLGPIWPVLPSVSAAARESSPPPPQTTVSPVHPLAPPVDEVRAPARREATAPPATIPGPNPVQRAPRPEWLLGLWLAGVVLVFGSYAMARWRVARLAAKSHEVMAGPLRELFEQLKAELGLRREVRLLRATGPAMPMTWGVRHPVVLLPAASESWP